MQETETSQTEVCVYVTAVVRLSCAELPAMTVPVAVAPSKDRAWWRTSRRYGKGP